MAMIRRVDGFVSRTSSRLAVVGLGGLPWRCCLLSHVRIAFDTPPLSGMGCSMPASHGAELGKGSLPDHWLVIKHVHLKWWEAASMGLDGGTIITRSDVLRGTSWALSQQDGTRSSRGGAVGTSKVYKKQELDKTSERCSFGRGLWMRESCCVGQLVVEQAGLVGCCPLPGACRSASARTRFESCMQRVVVPQAFCRSMAPGV